MTTIKQIHTAVWDFRRKYSEWWATPEPDDCLRYAFTEAGELMDAWLRSQRPDDARNNAKERSIPKELADVAIMLVSESQIGWDCCCYGPNVTVDEVCIMVGRCLEDKSYYSAPNALDFVVGYAEYNHIDLLAHVHANLEAIKHKHVPEDKWT
jgi:NTP pyrophosphatase (non-canonical NTP hydrolase)